MRCKITFKNGDIDFVSCSHHEEKSGVHLFFGEHPTRGEFILSGAVKSIDDAPKQDFKAGTPLMSSPDKGQD